MPPLLSISNLSVAVGDRPIIRDLSLAIGEGEVHAIMGPNGSGKSTLVNALMGHPAYEVIGGSVTFRGNDLLAMPTHERARAGLFLAFQYPKEIAGVTLRSFLFAAAKARLTEGAHGSTGSPQALSPIQFAKQMKEEMAQLSMHPDFAERSINKGFSGGEKKKSEILQLRVLKPALAMLDETDSGLDVDALKIVGAGVAALREERREVRAAEQSVDHSLLVTRSLFSCIVVTHYARILHHLRPDRVHVMIKGELKESGGAELAERLEKEGYARYGVPDGIALES